MSAHWEVKPGQLKPGERCHYGSHSKLAAIGERRALRQVGTESRIARLNTTDGQRWCVIVAEEGEGE
jgi:hypothetical protein